MAKRNKVLTIGVTGHRNIDEKSHCLRKAVGAAVDEVIGEFNPAALVVLSPLADGSDRLVAREALKRKAARLVVPLPMPQKDYETDFPNSVRPFRALLRRASGIIQAPLPKQGSAWQSYSKSRDHQYAWAGAYTARHCHVLIAIWDGEPPRGIGGTAHVIRWFRKGLKARTSAIVPARYHTDSEAAGGLPLAKAMKLIIIRADGTRVLP